MIHVEAYERLWIVASLVVLLVFAAALGIAGFAAGIQVPVPEARVNPNTVDETGPFADPGLRELAPGKYEAYVLAQASPWRYYPDEMRIPAGSRVTFYLTSADVQHGFLVPGTNINMMVLPGQVSKLTTTFEEPGTYSYICTEYCGVGHQNMFGTIIVE